ncbi:MAG: phosphopantothenoylcysteine decarboxylase, partial [Lachnospiraceae bacterium]|nr:phosphopantothenoylcysteine decarboxylase [Lachnospiraceae bacterium]
VTGQTGLRRPGYVGVVEVTSAADMFEAVTSRAASQDIIIKAAAVADYRPKTVADNKIKKKDEEADLSMPLERTDDILAWLGSHKKPGQILCGFSMETEHMLENSRKKLVKKNLDIIAANNLKEEGAGFGTTTNVLTLITRDNILPLPMMTKTEAAHRLLDEILRLQ